MGSTGVNDHEKNGSPMLVLISDLHFMDGSAGVDNLEAGVFRRMLGDMADRAREAKAKEVKIGLLGDIFDLIRSEFWFDIPYAHRPWGDEPSEAHAIEAFEAIVARNAETFEILSGSLADQFDFPVEPERIYVPGNHDRLCAVYPSLRSRSREVLGMEPGDHAFPPVLVDVDHGTYARHGHEFDPYNYEGAPVFGGLGDTPAELMACAATPIGDVIASEFASKLPIVLRRNLKEAGTPGDALVDKLRELFDVRPLGAIVDWLELQRMRQPKALEKVINESMRECAEDFGQNPFVSNWIEEHDDWTNPFDLADKLQMLYGILRSVSFTGMEAVLNLARDTSASGEAGYPEMARADFAHLDKDPYLREAILYAVYGHTHTPEQAAVSVIGEGATERERVYVNTGTWRPSHRRALDDTGFATWNNVTISYVYKPGEINGLGHRARYPTFETWTGSFG